MATPAQHARKLFAIYAFIPPTTDKDGKPLSAQARGAAAMKGLETWSTQSETHQRYAIAQLQFLLLQQLGQATDRIGELVDLQGDLTDVLKDLQEGEAPDDVDGPEADPKAEETARRQRLPPHLREVPPEDDSDDDSDGDNEPRGEDVDGG